MQSLIIAGAGGFGREVCNYAESLAARGKNWRVRGFIDDNPHALDGYDYPCGIVGGIADYVPRSGEVFLCALGAPAVRKKVVAMLAARGAVFERLVHPQAVLGRNVSVGVGAIVCPYAVLTCDIALGDFSIVNCHATCGHDSRIGAYATVSSHCDVTGYCRVGEGAFLGSHALLRPGVSVGDGATVGANALAMLNVKPRTTVFGTPAVALPPTGATRG